MKKAALLLTATLCSNSLFAGDMGKPMSFDGFYFGIGTGFISIFSETSHLTSRSNSTFIAGRNEVNRYTDTAIQFNGNLGFGKMVRDNAYLGVKGGIYYTPQEVTNETGFQSQTGLGSITATNTIRSSFKPIYNIDAVLGYEVLPNFLPFVEAGVSFANLNQNIQFKRLVIGTPSFAYGYTAFLDSYLTTFNVGLGLNYLFTQHGFFSLELLYNDLGDRSIVRSAPLGSTGVVETQTRKLSNQAVSLFASVSYLMDV